MYDWEKGRDVVARHHNINVLKGLTVNSVEKSTSREVIISSLYPKTVDALVFHTSCGKEFVMYHDQECCENVFLEDVCGNLDDLVGKPITMAECAKSNNFNDELLESETWTFYKLATIKGYVTLRWYGASNGYYSESVDFIEVIPKGV